MNELKCEAKEVIVVEEFLKENHFNRKMNIALIATYPKMSEIFLKIANTSGLGIFNIYASFEQAVKVAKDMEYKIDAILSRGGTADYIKNAVDIPVTFIPITPFDVAQVVHSLNRGIKEVAFFHYKRKILGIREIEQMYGIKIHEYTFIEKEDIKQGVQDAYNKGLATIIGGEVAVSCAKRLGMNGLEISAGEDAVNRAFYETLQILYEKEKEKSKSAQLKAAFASIAEGVIVVDENKKVVIYNPAAEKMFGYQNSKSLVLFHEICDNQYNNTFQNQEAEINYIKKIGNEIYASSHRPIFLDKHFVGVVSTFEDITKIQNLEKKIRNEMHTKGFIAKNTFEDILTLDFKMSEMKRLAKLYAVTDSTILIEGESGTGKELFAQSLHNASHRADGPFVAINCGAIPENLLESELFGYEAGAFTGAKKEGKQGLFELAHNGSIFLDEIGEISKTLQTRLLRVLQEKEVMRIGGNKITPVNIRIISATNKNLKSMAEKGEFREDLYYRLNVFHLKIPPLRDRKEDIFLLGNQFLEKNAIVMEYEDKKKIFAILQGYRWPGNIRELQNVIERISILKSLKMDEKINDEDMIEILGLQKLELGSYIDMKVKMEGTLKEMLSNVEKEIVERLMEEYHNDQELVAEHLGIGRTTLWRKSK